MIRLENVSLDFPMHGPRGIRDALARLFSVAPPGPENRFAALKDISLSVRRGERVGIIGFNGAGKTTLLKTMCEIYPPTEGRVVVDGDIACLFEIATGRRPTAFALYATGVIGIYWSVYAEA